MPNLDFYAFDSDRQLVLDLVYGLGGFRVFEQTSEHDSLLREFTRSADVPTPDHGPHLMLYPIDAGPGPVALRVDFKPGAVANASFRYDCRGWGMIQLSFGGFFQERELRWSHTNHNSEKRALKWAEVYPELGDPGEWDFKAVAQASGRLIRAIRAAAVDKITSHPVLPAAARLIEERSLRYEIGAGIQAHPARTEHG